MFESRGGRVLVWATPRWQCGETWHGITHSQVEIVFQHGSRPFSGQVLLRVSWWCVFVCFFILLQCDYSSNSHLFQSDAAGNILHSFSQLQFSNENSQNTVCHSQCHCCFHTAVKCLQMIQNVISKWFLIYMHLFSISRFTLEVHKRYLLWIETDVCMTGVNSV